MTAITTQPRTNGTAARLIRQLIEHLGPGTQLIGSQEREWASATFSGARHSLDLHVPMLHDATQSPTSIAALPDHEFALVGEIVADCAVALRPRQRDANGQWWLPVQVEILTVTAD